MSVLNVFTRRRRIAVAVAGALALSTISISPGLAAAREAEPLVTSCVLSAWSTTLGPGEATRFDIDVEPSPGQARVQTSVDGTVIRNELETLTDDWITVTYDDLAGAGAMTSVSFDIVAVDEGGEPVGGSALCSLTFYRGADTRVFWQTPVALPEATVGVPYTQDLVAGGVTSPSCTTIEDASVPGMTLSHITVEPLLTLVPPDPVAKLCHVLGGTPTTPGTYTFVLRTQVGLGVWADREFTLVVRDAPAPDVLTAPVDDTAPAATPRFTG